VRFDDSLSTVLAAETRSAFGAQSAFRQIVDLVARGRVAPGPELLGRLTALRPHVPAKVRAASARGLALAAPPAALIEFFATDEATVATPVLRIATLDDAEWSALLPQIGPLGRSILRDRRDLSAHVVRALDSFGSTDFALGFEAAEASDPLPQAAAPSGAPAPLAPEPATPLTLVAVPAGTIPPGEPPPHGFPIAELVDRIAAFQRERPQPEAPVPPVARFRFETDSLGRVVWTDAEPRGAVLGQSPAILATAATGRHGLRAGRLALDHGPLAGSWRIDAMPQFDAGGRYLGLAGAARRSAVVAAGAASGEAIRRLVHELRTPLNAISGFAELMTAELFGPVPAAHRQAAGAIHQETASLLAAIEDLDLAARMEGDALSMSPGEIGLWAMLDAAIAPHGGRIALHGDRDATLVADEPTLRRLVGRFVDVVAGAGETAVIGISFDGHLNVISTERPRAWGDGQAEMLAGEGIRADNRGPLLGTGFTLRLIADLARLLGGSFEEQDRLTLRLPRRFNREVRIGGLR
jgi:hypothetical protein